MANLKSSSLKSKLAIPFGIVGLIVVAALVVIINPFNIPKILEQNKV